mgnify:CR=1 FL=1
MNSNIRMDIRGLHWKTTGPGWQSINGGTKVGHDIEIVNGRNLKVNKEYQEGQFSVTYEEMYKDGTHGDQFAELNCENIGALYQDILTTPSSECYWDLDHAGRWNQKYDVCRGNGGKRCKEIYDSRAS